MQPTTDHFHTSFFQNVNKVFEHVLKNVKKKRLITMEELILIKLL